MTYVVTPNLSVIHGLQCTALNWAVTRRVGRAWINATVLKTVEQKCSVGSNPTLSSTKSKLALVGIGGLSLKWERTHAVSITRLHGRLAESGLLHLFAKEALSKKQS